MGRLNGSSLLHPGIGVVSVQTILERVKLSVVEVAQTVKDAQIVGANQELTAACLPPPTAHSNVKRGVQSADRRELLEATEMLIHTRKSPTWPCSLVSQLAGGLWNSWLRGA